MKYKRQIVLDTETTGFNINKKHYKNHKIIEIGAVEIINRNITKNYFHTYLKPNRNIDIEAFKIHGISNKFLKNKPTFNKIANSFFNFIKNSELIIHNAKFDIGFINNEFRELKDKKFRKIHKFYKVIDTLKLSRSKFPKKKNNLNALCLRYKINIEKRKYYHGALLDAKLLAKIFLLMTRKKNVFKFKKKKKKKVIKIIKKRTKLLYAKKEELKIHNRHIKIIKNNMVK